MSKLSIPELRGAAEKCRRPFFFLAAWLLLTIHYRVSAAPHIEIPAPVWNFGVVTNLAELTHDFVISNFGDAPLEIEQIRTSCSACLAAGMKETRIPPQGSAIMHSRLDLHLMDDEIARDIFFECNDPRTPAITLELNGVVVPAYQVFPEALKLDVSQGERMIKVDIASLFKLNAGLSRVICDFTNIQTAISSLSSNYFELTLRVTATFPQGDTFARLTVQSDNPEDLPCHMTVWIHNPPDFELIPEKLDFDPGPAPQTRILWLKQHGTNILELVDVLPPSDRFQCEIDPNSNGTDYRIYVSGNYLTPDMTNGLTVQLKDSEGRKRSVIVPIVVGNKRAGF